MESQSVSQRPPEQEIYREMWKHPEYRQVAPGESCVHEFLKQARPKAGAHVLDLGCGTGRASLLMAFPPPAGGNLSVTMVDFAENCLDDDIREMLKTQPQALRFVQADLTETLQVAAQYALCFPAGTPIQGSGKTIDKISVGDTVVNRVGEKQKVKKVFKRLYTGDMVNISVSCMPDIMMTPEHPVLVSSVKRVHRKNSSDGKKSIFEWVASEPKWKSAKDVCVGDWVSSPKISDKEQQYIKFKINGGGNGRKETTKNVEYVIDEGVAWLLGLYVAEGCVNQGRIAMYLNAKETALAERAVMEFGRIGIHARIDQPPSIKNNNGLKVSADAILLAELLDEWCGHGAGKKRVPQAIMCSPDSVVRSFLMGLVDGDGCLRKDGRNGYLYYSISTISRQLGVDVLTLLHKIGVYAAMPNPSPPRAGSIKGRKVFGKESFVVLWSKRSWDGKGGVDGRVPYGRSKFIGNRVYCRVNGSSKNGVKNLPVFNIHTEDETYGVPFTVHNCTDVMEHIPPENVDRVLDNILHAGQHVFFQISTVDDVCGKLIGHPLHLTVKPYEWWLEKFRSRDCIIHWSKDFGDHCMFYVTAWVQGKQITESGALNLEEEKAKANVLHNCSQDWQQVSPHESNDLEIMILGGGYSLPQFEDEIKKKREEGVKLVTLNGTYNWALEHGLTPSAQIIVDARPFNARFTKPVVDKCLYLISSQCDPSVLEGLPKDRTWLWHTSAEMFRDILDKCYKQWWAVPGGSTALLRGIPLLRLLGYRKFHLYGCDSCLSDDGAHHAYAQPENDGQMVVPVTLNDGRVFKCTPALASQATEFMDLIKFLGDEIELNVAGDGLLAHSLRLGADMADAEPMAMF